MNKEDVRIQRHFPTLDLQTTQHTTPRSNEHHLPFERGKRNLAWTVPLIDSVPALDIDNNHSSLRDLNNMGRASVSSCEGWDVMVEAGER